MSRPGQSLFERLWLSLCLVALFGGFVYSRLDNSDSALRVVFGLMLGAVFGVALWLAGHDFAHRLRGQPTHALRDAMRRPR